MPVNDTQVVIMNEAIARIVRQGSVWLGVPADAKFAGASLQDVIEFSVLAFTNDWPAILRQLNAAGDPIGAWPKPEAQPAPSGWQPNVVQLVAEALRPFAEIGALLFARPHVPDTDVMVELRGINGQRGGLTRGQFKAAHEARQRLTESAELAPSGWQQRIAAERPSARVRDYLRNVADCRHSDRGHGLVCMACVEVAVDCLWQNAVDAGQPAKSAEARKEGDQ